MSVAGVSATYDSLLQKRVQLEQDLRTIEKQIYDLEGSYLEESSHFGNILRGWDGYYSGTARRAVKDSDRIFSSSSVTAPQGSFIGDSGYSTKRLNDGDMKKVKSSKKKAKLEDKLEKRKKKMQQQDSD